MCIKIWMGNIRWISITMARHWWHRSLIMSAYNDPAHDMLWFMSTVILHISHICQLWSAPGDLYTTVTSMGLISCLRAAEITGILNVCSTVVVFSAYVQANIKPRATGPLWVQSNSDRWLPSQIVSNTKSFSMSWRHYVYLLDLGSWYHVTKAFSITIRVSYKFQFGLI